jgi:ribonuclease P protein component
MERHPLTSDEADLPAQEEASRQGTRFPSPDEDHRGTPGSGRPPRARPQEAHGLITDRGQNSPRLVMLSRPEDFAALQSSGTVRSHPLLVVRVRRTDLEVTRFGLSTGRKLGGAVVRNRVRRRLREVLRVMAPSFQPGWDVLIIARSPVISAEYDALTDAVHHLLRRGGVLGGRTVP